LAITEDRPDSLSYPIAIWFLPYFPSARVFFPQGAIDSPLRRPFTALLQATTAVHHDYFSFSYASGVRRIGPPETACVPVHSQRHDPKEDVPGLMDKFSLLDSEDDE